MLKFAIKREQSQACLGYAECEQIEQCQTSYSLLLIENIFIIMFMLPLKGTAPATIDETRNNCDMILIDDPVVVVKLRLLTIRTSVPARMVIALYI